MNNNSLRTKLEEILKGIDIDAYYKTLTGNNEKTCIAFKKLDLSTKKETIFEIVKDKLRLNFKSYDLFNPIGLRKQFKDGFYLKTEKGWKKEAN